MGSGKRVNKHLPVRSAKPSDGEIPDIAYNLLKRFEHQEGLWRQKYALCSFIVGIFSAFQPIIFFQSSDQNGKSPHHSAHNCHEFVTGWDGYRYGCSMART